MTLLDAAALVIPEVDTPAEQACCVVWQTILRRWSGLPLEDDAAFRLYPELRRPWSPVEAMVEAGIGVRVEAPAIGRWSGVQGWRLPGDPERLARGEKVRGTGHTFGWYAASADFGWQLDGVVGRKPDARPRAWADVVAEFAGGLAIARLKRPPKG